MHAKVGTEGMLYADNLHRSRPDNQYKGTFKLPNADGYQYTGPFVNGEKQGTGAIQFSIGCQYEGDVANSMMHGSGVRT